MAQDTGAGRFWGIPGLVFTVLLLSSQPALADFTQQAKLVGTGGSEKTKQGWSVALSCDGNTAIVGGPMDNHSTGAAWIFTRSGSVWTQQGNKLVGTGAIGQASQGAGVALSCDGNTAIVGGPGDKQQTGAAWIFTRSGSVWTQQGNKLVGAGAIGDSNHGLRVALSCDGNTAIVGGIQDAQPGSAFIFSRSGSVWTQQGNKLVGTGAMGPVIHQGYSVALSCDGNTAIVGGPSDNGQTGAAWIFSRSGSVWTQQGNKLVGTGAIGDSYQGSSVSLSSDGSTAIVGGLRDNGLTGAAWIFTRSGGEWTQQGNKLVGAGAIGESRQGWSASLSCDGNRAIVGGPGDNTLTGAAWIFTRSGSVWTQQGNKLVGTGAIGQALRGTGVALACDGNTAIVGGPDGVVAAAWVYVPKGPQAPAKSLIEVAIDPMALILQGKALEIWYELKHPHEPNVDQVRRVLQSMTPDEQQATLNRARILTKYGKIVEDAIAGMKR